jgi:putative hydrolase of the HAD superfamily
MRGIILDLDDTLYPREDFVRSGFDAVARYVEHSWRRPRLSVQATLLTAHADGRAGREFQALCEEHQLPLSLVPVLITIFRGHRPSIRLDPDVRLTLETLRHEGWRLVLLTNGDPAVQRRKVEALDLARFVDGVIYAEEHAPGGKPDPLAFRAALECLRLASRRCICVGDDPVCDIEGARRAGVRTIRVSAARPGATTARDADAVIASVVDLPKYVRRLVPETADAA